MGFGQVPLEAEKHHRPQRLDRTPSHMSAYVRKGGVVFTGSAARLLWRPRDVGEVWVWPPIISPFHGFYQFYKMGNSCGSAEKNTEAALSKQPSGGWHQGAWESLGPRRHRLLLKVGDSPTEGLGPA